MSRTVSLTLAVAIIRIKELVAITAFASLRLNFHEATSLERKRPHSNKKQNSEEDKNGRSKKMIY
jgi:hypothetical protein